MTLCQMIDRVRSWQNMSQRVVSLNDTCNGDVHAYTAIHRQNKVTTPFVKNELTELTENRVTCMSLLSQIMFTV